MPVHDCCTVLATEFLTETEQRQRAKEWAKEKLLLKVKEKLPHTPSTVLTVEEQRRRARKWAEEGQVKKRSDSRSPFIRESAASTARSPSETASSAFVAEETCYVLVKDHAEPHMRTLILTCVVLISIIYFVLLYGDVPWSKALVKT